MEIISAKDYGYRVVIRICFNPNAPQWVHTVGECAKDSAGVDRVTSGGDLVLITSSIVPAGETGETCHNCHYNWDVSEVVFEGSSLFRSGPGGEWTRFTDDELADAAFLQVARPDVPLVLDGLEGRSG